MSYFVKISDPNGVRKRLLESSKDLLHMLRGYHRILDIRDQKRELGEKLRSLMKELAMYGEELDRLLPQESLKDIEQYLPKKTKKAAKKQGKKAKEEPVEERVPEHNESQRLEKALANIEERLSKL